MAELLYVVPQDVHDRLVADAFRSRGYDDEETRDATRLCAEAARHGIRTHNAIKALHLDAHFGSQAGGCAPGARIEKLSGRFSAVEVWNANLKLGPTVAYQAMERCVQLSERHGVGIVCVDNAFHYFWGGAYVLEVARRGYIGYTQCTAMLAEVAPFGGKRAALGTNPHSWAFPPVASVGFSILIDWATSAIAMGRVQQLAREGKRLPPGCALDGQGDPTVDPAAVATLLPFGAHKGYGLGLVNEVTAALIGGSLPSMRGRFASDAEKHSSCFYFQVIHPEALHGKSFDGNRSPQENLEFVLEDILRSGNETALLPGQLEAEFAAKSSRAGGFLFTEAEIDSFRRLAEDCGQIPWEKEGFARLDH